MNRSIEADRVAGFWLAVASLLMILVLLFHGPIAPALEDQMSRIAGDGTRWTVVHWIAAVALSLYAVAGLIVLTSESRLTDSGPTMTAWAVLAVGALWTVITAVTEATVVADAAMAGATEMFEAWWAFGEGAATGFTFLALAVAVIAGAEARSSGRSMPAWAAWIGVVAGIASFTGWALGMWMGIPAGNLLWVSASVIMSAWTLWFGLALLRYPEPSLSSP